MNLIGRLRLSAAMTVRSSNRSHVLMILADHAIIASHFPSVVFNSSFASRKCNE